MQTVSFRYSLRRSRFRPSATRAKIPTARVTVASAASTAARIHRSCGSFRPNQNEPKRSSTNNGSEPPRNEAWIHGKFRIAKKSRDPWSPETAGEQHAPERAGDGNENETELIGQMERREKSDHIGQAPPCLVWVLRRFKC